MAAPVSNSNISSQFTANPTVSLLDITGAYSFTLQVTGNGVPNTYDGLQVTYTGSGARIIPNQLTAETTGDADVLTEKSACIQTLFRQREP